MTLLEEIAIARKEIVSDGYDMSVGELINLYRDGELKIDPAFQRLFRWDSTRKTRFIESILLGLPLPPIFVYQRKDGVWELIDGVLAAMPNVGRDADFDRQPSRRST
jgi:hypothetical protein